MEPPYDSTQDNSEHIFTVQEYMARFTENLFNRAYWHDESKLVEPEKSGFDAHIPKLKTLKFGSPEYEQGKKDLGATLLHHYEHNSHHPEFYAITDGVLDEDIVKIGLAISRMSLADICEMLVDWKAASLRMKDGDIYKSITINAKKFGIGNQLKQILINTAKEMGY